jgi:hypothetical protein
MKKRRLALPIGLALAVAAVTIVAAGRLLTSGSGHDGSLPDVATHLDRAAAVRTATDLVVAAGAAGARSASALRDVQRRSFAASVEPGLEALTLRASAQQRRAMLNGTPPGAILLERTVPVGYQLTRFSSAGASVAVWTLDMAGPDRGHRAPGAWWLTTRVDLVPEVGRWRVRDAVAVEGPAPRLIRVQQAGVGAAEELRGMLRTSRAFTDEP